LRDGVGRHGRGRDQSRETSGRRRQPPLRATVRRRLRRWREWRKPYEPVLCLAEPEQAERVRGLPAAGRQGDNPEVGRAVARAHRELHTRHIGQVSDRVDGYS